MDILEQLISRLEGIDPTQPLAFGLVVVAGLLMGIAPSSLPLAAVVVGYVAGRGSSAPDTSRQALLPTIGFVLGIATVDAAVGALFATLGATVLSLLARNLALANLAMAIILCVMGLALLRKIRVRISVLRPTAARPPTMAKGYLLGLPFGLSTCPACTPMILPIMGAAAVTGDPWLGGALLFCFGLARGAPLIVAALAAGAVTRMERLSAWLPAIERGGGYLLLLAGLYFFYLAAMYKGWVPLIRL